MNQLILLLKTEQPAAVILSPVMRLLSCILHALLALQWAQLKRLKAIPCYCCLNLNHGTFL